MATEKKLSVPEEQVSAAEDVKKETVKKSKAAKTEAAPDATEAAAVKKAAPKKVTAKKTAADGEETPAETKAKKPAAKKKTEEPAAEEKPTKKAPAKKSTAEKPAAEEAAPEVKTEAKPVAETEAVAKPAPKVAVKPAPQDDEEMPSGEQVSFDDEEAALAASDPDLDMGDETEEEGSDVRSEELAQSLDGISRMNKKELVDFFATLLESKPVQQIRREAEAIKVAFYKIHRAEYEQNKKQFIADGGDPEQYVPSVDMEEARLKELFAGYRRQRAEYIANLEKAKEDNLKVKLQIIEDLKELINGNETLNNTFNSFRELQQRWRDTGVVPQANVKELWETYNLHVENFYNYIKINKELRDLDLKRNYETKLQLCEAAEALILEPSIVGAFRQLQELHDRWRETGPVSNEHKESLWDRFKEASSRINKQHQEHFEGLKEEQRRNLELKAELCLKAEELSREILTTRKDWNRASDSLIEIQKVWKTIGFAPQKDNTRIYERFRRACDRFFELKRNFYDQAKAEMENNLQQKLEICVAAELLKESDQWKKATDELIALQRQWKEIGPVSRRHSDTVWKRFRSACDHFFERKSSHFSGVDAEHDGNLQAKLALLAEMEAADIQTGGFEAIKEFQRRWNEIGFVPIKQKNEIQKRYKAVVDDMFGKLRSGERGRSMERFRDKVNTMKGSGDRRLKSERDRLYNKVKQLEADVTLLENNIGFFSKSKNAEAMIRDVQEKIERAKREIAETIEKVKLIDSQQE